MCLQNEPLGQNNGNYRIFVPHSTESKERSFEHHTFSKKISVIYKKIKIKLKNNFGPTEDNTRIFLLCNMEINNHKRENSIHKRKKRVFITRKI